MGQPGPGLDPGPTDAKSESDLKLEERTFHEAQKSIIRWTLSLLMACWPVHCTCSLSVTTSLGESQHHGKNLLLPDNKTHYSKRLTGNTGETMQQRQSPADLSFQFPLNTRIGGKMSGVPHRRSHLLKENSPCAPFSQYCGHGHDPGPGLVPNPR